MYHAPHSELSTPRTTEDLHPCTKVIFLLILRYFITLANRQKAQSIIDQFLKCVDEVKQCESVWEQILTRQDLKLDALVKGKTTRLTL